MYFDRQKLEELEDKALAPYGVRSKDAKGRAYLDDEPDYRTAFQRDRDRIIHTTAFRRPRIQDPGLHQQRRRLLPHAADPHARSCPSRTNHRRTRWERMKIWSRLFASRTISVTPRSDILAKCRWRG